MIRLSRVFCRGSILTNYVNNSGRTLYTLNSLGIDSYVKKSEIVKQYYLTDGRAFREKMEIFVRSEGTSMALTTFTEVLKNMIHLAKRNKEDLQLLEAMLRKFNKQCKETGSDNYFVFGPVVMRCLHHINKPDIALKLFKDPEFHGFFDQLMSCHILCDMLYEQGRYVDVVDVYETMRSRLQFKTYPRHVVTLVFAACYKENTFDSFKYSWKLFMAVNRDGYILLRRAVAFAAALALKQGAYDIALRTTEAVHQQNYVIAQSIKVEALTNLGRVADAMVVLKEILRAHDTATKCTITKDSVNILRDKVNATADYNLIQKFNNREKLLIENGHVDDRTLDDLLTREIDSGIKLDSAPEASSNKNNPSKIKQKFEFRRTPYNDKAERWKS